MAATVSPIAGCGRSVHADAHGVRLGCPRTAASLTALVSGTEGKGQPCRGQGLSAPALATARPETSLLGTGGC